MVPEINALELAQRLAAPNPPIIIDVRELDEYQYCRIEGAQLKPLGCIEQWSAELDREAEYVLMCHVGGRSGQATGYLQRLGFKHVLNLRGGIDAWSATVDPKVPRY
jgi:rhodanese-related sulfurtransferase